MASITFGGLSSQLDTEAIISSLVNVKTQQLITPLQNRIAELSTRQAAMASLQSQISSFKSIADSLKDSDVTGRTASSGNTDLLSIGSVDTDAVAGVYDVTVNTFATTDKVYFNGVADTDTTTFGTGTITITSNGIARSIDIDSTNNTLQGIVDAINDTSGIEVTASIVNDGSATPYRLVLTSNETGDDADITHDIDTVLVGPPALTVDAALTAANDSVDAQVTINSLLITQSTNTFTDAIPGVTFTILDDDPLDTFQVTVTEDYSSTTSAISAFVAAFNNLASTFDSQFDYNESTETLGILGDDMTVQMAQSTITTLVTSVYSALGNSTYTSLSSMGISLESGRLVIDTSQLNEALANEPNEIRTLFQGVSDSTSTEDGMMEKISNYLETLVDSTDGALTIKGNTYTEKIDYYNELITEREDRIEAYEANLEARFVYLEEVMARLNSMQATIENFAAQLTNSD